MDPESVVLTLDALQALVRSLQAVLEVVQKTGSALHHRPCKILITGASGSGKSTYRTKYLLNAPGETKFIFDHQGEFALRCKVKPAFYPSELANGVASGWCIFDPCRIFPGRLPDAFDFFAEFALEICKRQPGRKVFACDELQKLTATNVVSRELAEILETGRRYGLDCCFISQQPNLIHNRIRNQLTELVSFRQMDAMDLDFLEQNGIDGERGRALRLGEFSTATWKPPSWTGACRTIFSIRRQRVPNSIIHLFPLN